MWTFFKERTLIQNPSSNGAVVSTKMSAIPTEKMPEDVEMEGAPEASATPADAPAAQGDVEQPATEKMVIEEPAAAEAEEPAENVESADKMDEDVGEIVWNKKVIFARSPLIAPTADPTDFSGL